MVQIHRLVKSYGGFKAVNDLSFEVIGGEILGLVGPNGAGKTTTLRCLSGIVPPTSGRILCAGYDLAAQPLEAKRRLAFVADEPRLFEYLTVWDHMLVVGRLYGVADVAERGRELLREVEIGDRLDAYPSELSRGMKQKLMIATALLRRPQVLILDEPLTGLDPGAMRRMRRTILATAAAGAAVIVSSHMLNLVEQICGRVLILNEGKQVVVGTLGQIRTALPGLGAEADLEDIFLRATARDDGG